jgi:acyl-ACP thioesterase
MQPLPERPAAGRTYSTRFRVRLSDMDPDGRVRLDALARYLQDAATEDVEETGWGTPDHLWVLRSVRIDAPAPLLEDRILEVTTWGSGLASLAAARRWSITGDADGSAEVDSVWIHLGPDGRPRRIGDGFDEYRKAAGGRSVSTRLELPDPPADAPRTTWPIRATDLDLMGHVNNAAYWKAVEDRFHEARAPLRRPYRARLDYRHPLDLGERVELAEFSAGDGQGIAFVADDAVKAVALVEPLG